MKPLVRSMLVSLGATDCMCLDSAEVLRAAFVASAEGRKPPVCPVHGEPEGTRAARAAGQADAARVAAEASLPLNAPVEAYPALGGLHKVTDL
jgi:hypothetical protein